MLCPKCNVENPAEARFCGKCGNTLRSATPPTPSISGAAPKKSRLPLLVLLAGAAVIILGIGLSVILYLANAHKREQAGNLGEPGYTAGTLPTAEAGAPPLAKETPPENSTAVNDAFYRKKAVGNWLVRKQRDNGIDMEMLWAYSANGLLNCTGTITGQRQKYYIVMSGIWEIKDGHLNIKIDVSNIPEFVAPGDTSSYRIITLTDSEWTYVVTEDGKTETANRIR